MKYLLLAILIGTLMLLSAFFFGWPLVTPPPLYPTCKIFGYYGKDNLEFWGCIEVRANQSNPHVPNP